MLGEDTYNSGKNFPVCMVDTQSRENSLSIRELIDFSECLNVLVSYSAVHIDWRTRWGRARGGRSVMPGQLDLTKETRLLGSGLD